MRVDTRGYIAGMDVLRAGAALMVMLFHLAFWNWILHPTSPMPPAYRAFMPVSSPGWIGVEIFFVISGFIIAYSAEGVTARTFAKHRILRLVPAALVCATCTGMGILSERLAPFKTVALWWTRSVSFWPEGPWIDGSYWTLPIEVAFYGVVFLCLASGRTRWTPLVMATMGVVSTLWCVVDFHYRWPEPNAIPLLRYGCFFAFGSYLDRGFRRGWTCTRASVAALCTCGCLAEILLHGFQPKALTLWIAAVCFLWLSVVANARVHCFLGVRGLRLTRKIGLATYPLYLLHAQLGRLLIGVYTI